MESRPAGRYDCATVIGKSRHPGADNGAFGAQEVSGGLLDGVPGDNECHSASHWPPVIAWEVLTIHHLPLLRKE